MIIFFTLIPFLSCNDFYIVASGLEEILNTLQKHEYGHLQRRKAINNFHIICKYIFLCKFTCNIDKSKSETTVKLFDKLYVYTKEILKSLFFNRMIDEKMQKNFIDVLKIIKNYTSHIKFYEDFKNDYIFLSGFLTRIGRLYLLDCKNKNNLDYTKENFLNIIQNLYKIIPKNDLYEYIEDIFFIGEINLSLFSH
ncbi:hypothetical protein H311_02723 [Anncaliia algerae PRA109]|nr:hypothetical protein H311_02723 [Anncaliia algerae PRA109]